MEVPVNKESMFNSSFESLRRIQETLTECNNESKMACISVSGSDKITYLNAWIISLKNLFKEIHAKINQKEREHIFNLFKKAARINLTSEKRKSDGKVLKEIDKSKYAKKWEELWNIEVTLRLYASQKGLLLKDKDNAMEMF